MTDPLAPIAGKLARCIRMLSSDKDGDVISAARGIMRTLRGAGADIHTLADRLEKPNGGALTDAEMKKLYDAGFAAGARATENKFHGDDDFRDANVTPTWHDMATWCQRHSARLGSREREFIDQMAERTVWREPTEKQGKWLKSIWHRLGGGRGS
jgi:hypothetical protein